MTSQWGVTPRFGGAQTPMVGSMTPMHGMGSGRTPMYGSQTPQHGDGQLTISTYILINMYVCIVVDNTYELHMYLQSFCVHILCVYR